MYPMLPPKPRVTIARREATARELGSRDARPATVASRAHPPWVTTVQHAPGPHAQGERVPVRRAEAQHREPQGFLFFKW